METDWEGWVVWTGLRGVVFAEEARTDLASLSPAALVGEDLVGVFWAGTTLLEAFFGAGLAE
ncbi:MAG: hypothetical protein OHK005_14240 [Candidatus Methylacidiphilales bacterium]